MTLARRKLPSNEYQQFQRFRQNREAFFEWLDVTSTRDAERNIGLTNEDVLAAIEHAREEARRRLNPSTTLCAASLADRTGAVRL